MSESAAAMKKAKRMLLIRLHPDKCMHEAGANATKTLNSAWDASGVETKDNRRLSLG